MSAAGFILYIYFLILLRCFRFDVKLQVKCLLSAPAASSAPSAPRDVLEALEQRRAKYEEASSQAKASGDDRKARMHDRIAKVRTNPSRHILFKSRPESGQRR